MVALGVKAGERLLISKKISNRDELDQLYLVLKACLADDDVVVAELWTMREVKHAKPTKGVEKTAQQALQEVPKAAFA